MSKYDMLDRAYDLAELEPVPEERLESVVASLGSLGVDCEIVT